jgi:MFS family permease
MVFSHLIFIYAFLPLLLILYYCRQNNGWRRGVLLAFSLVFYAWGEPKYVFLMLLSVGIGYLAGRLMDKLPRKTVMIVSVTMCLLFLIILHCLHLHQFQIQQVELLVQQYHL